MFGLGRPVADVADGVGYAEVGAPPALVAFGAETEAMSVSDEQCEVSDGEH